MDRRSKERVDHCRCNQCDQRYENGVQQVTATIVDDDTTLVNLTLAPTAWPRTAVPRASRRRCRNPSTQNVTVNLAFTGSATLGSDYTRSAAAITILAGNTSGSLT